MGETACVSVHGANRLGGNSLLDLVVFGRAAGLYLEQALKTDGSVQAAGDSDFDACLSRMHSIKDSSKGEKTASLRNDLQQVMQKSFGVFYS